MTFTRMFFGPILVATLCGCASGQGMALNASSDETTVSGSSVSSVVTERAEFPNGTFLENMVLMPSGDMLVTSYFDKSVLKVQDDGQVTTFTTLPDHPVGIIRDGSGFVLTAHAIPFSDAPSFMSSNAVLRIDAEGTVTTRIDAPDAKFLNGLVRLPDGTVLAADSIAGTVWSVDLARKSLDVYLADQKLTPDPSASTLRPGANGLKVWDDALYISNSSRGAIYEVANFSTPQIDRSMETGPVDDFAFLGDGSIVAATHGETLIRISTDGTVDTLMNSGCGACTAVAVTASGDIDVLTTGGLLDGGTEPARILRVGLAEPVASSARLAAPGVAHTALDPLIGHWNVVMKVYPAPGADPIVSRKMSADRRWVLGGRYMEEDLYGEFAGRPSKRLGWLGYNALSEQYEFTTIDTFEPGQMSYSGSSMDEGRRLVLFGTSTEAGYAAQPTRIERQLRFEIEQVEAGSVQRIFVTYPGEPEHLFVEHIFTRSD